MSKGVQSVGRPNKLVLPDPTTAIQKALPACPPGLAWLAHLGKRLKGGDETHPNRGGSNARLSCNANSQDSVQS
jgi:hypothetical protein